MLRTLCWGVLAFGLAACEGEPPALRVGPLEFTDEDLGALGRTQQSTLADLAALGLAVADGRTDSLIHPHLERDLRSIVLQQLAMELAADRAGMGEEELRQLYERSPRYELVVRHLVVLSERWRPAEHRDSARAVATEALRRARAGEPFEGLAAEYSDEPGAEERGGLLTPGREGSWVPEFWRSASGLGVGEISSVVETEFGFHVIRLEDRDRVPFEEVRDEVLREVMNLPSALGRAEDWARERMASAMVDTAAVRAWQATTPVGALIRWPDSVGIPAFTADELAAFRHTAPDGRLEALRAEPIDRVLAFVEAAAQTHMMMHLASRLGIAPSVSQRAAIQQRWENRIARWATALGFERGQSRQEVREQALQAVGAAEQTAAIARTELAELSPWLRDLYPVSRPGAPTP